MNRRDLVKMYQARLFDRKVERIEKEEAQPPREADGAEKARRAINPDAPTKGKK